VIAEYNLSEAEAWTIITQGVNFGVTQVVDGNWGVHAVIPKAIFEKADPVKCTSPAATPTRATSDVPVFVGAFTPLKALLALGAFFMVM
jgi:hypothetical protein